MASEPNPAQLPTYTLDVQAMDLGADIKSVGLELIETESREPFIGPEAAAIWASALAAIAAAEPLAIDFFSHLDRVREFCATHSIAFREAATRCLVISQPSPQDFRRLLERFEKETFGIRVGARAATDDSELEGELSHRGLDAYQAAYARYTFCAICDLSDGWVTLLSETLWPSEVIRRVRPSLQPYDVYLIRPQ